MEFLFLNQGLNLAHSAVKAWCPDLWTTRNSPVGLLLKMCRFPIGFWGTFCCAGTQMPEGRFSLGLCLRKMPLTGGCSTWFRDGPHSSSHRDLTSMCRHNPHLSWFGVLAFIGFGGPFVVSTPVCSGYCFLFPINPPGLPEICRISCTSYVLSYGFITWY